MENNINLDKTVKQEVKPVEQTSMPSIPNSRFSLKHNFWMLSAAALGILIVASLTIIILIKNANDIDIKRENSALLNPSNSTSAAIHTVAPTDSTTPTQSPTNSSSNTNNSDLSTQAASIDTQLNDASNSVNNVNSGLTQSAPDFSQN